MGWTCEFCGSPGNRLYDVDIEGYTSAFMRCTGCGSCQVHDVVPDHVLAGLYDDSYFEGIVWDQIRADGLALHYVRQLGRHAPSLIRAGNTLEVGAGYGFFGHRVAERTSLSVDLIEPGRVCRDYILEMFPTSPLIGRSLDEVAPGAGYDVVFAFHLIEHLPRSEGFLSQVAEVLRPGGALVLITPNALASGFARYREKWLWARPDQHLQFLSPRSPASYFARLGYEIEVMQPLTPAWVGYPATWHLRCVDAVDRLTSRIDSASTHRRDLRLLRRMLIRLEPWLDPRPPGMSAVRWERILKKAKRPARRDELFLVLRRT